MKTPVERESWSRGSGIITTLEVPLLLDVVSFQATTALVWVAEKMDRMELTSAILRDAVIRGLPPMTVALSVGDLVASASNVVLPFLDLGRIHAYHLAFELDVPAACEADSVDVSAAD